MPYVMTTAEMIAALLALVASPGAFFGGKLSLFIDDKHPQKGDVVGDYTAFASNGFTAAVALTWGTPYTNDNGGAEVLGASHTFLTTSAPGSPVTLYGYYITDSAGTGLLLAERFADPVVISRDNQAFTMQPRLTLDS